MADEHTRENGPTTCRPIPENGTFSAWNTTDRHRPERRPTLAIRPPTPGADTRTMATTRDTDGWRSIILGVLLLLAGIAFALGIYLYSDTLVINGTCTVVTPDTIPPPPLMGPPK